MMSLIEALRPLRRVGWLRSGVYLAIILKRRALGVPWASPTAFEQKYASGPDGWGYETPAGHERLARAAQLLDSVLQGRRLRRALEIGCAEGTFTQLLTERCEDLLAVDFAPSALARAGARRDWNDRVRFQQLDLMRERLSGSFDLITLMDVLDYFSTHEMKAACEKVLACLPPGGYLLMTGVKQADVFDTAWWSKWIIWGGQRIKRHLAEHPLLKPVAEDDLDTHVLAIFEKIGPIRTLQ
jgi:SAM-dependent methyltransferase